MADRVSTEHVEVFVVPDTQKARVSTEHIEVFVVPNTQKARISAEYIEVFISGATAPTQVNSDLTFDAIIQKPVAKDFAFDAGLREPAEGDLMIDRAIRELVTDDLEIDAEVEAYARSSFTFSAAVTGAPGPIIKVDGVDITSAVIFKDATFTMLTNGGVGSFKFRVKDKGHDFTFVTGAEVILQIDGIRRFGGYLTRPGSGFFFDVDDTSVPSLTARVHVLEGVDYNILFAKRVVRDKSDPNNVELRSWDAGSHDDVIIKYVFDNYTDLGDDGATYAGVEHIGSPNPDKKGVVGSGGLYFGDLMREINRLISGVWYFNPDKDLTFTDVDTPNATKSLSDNPAGGSEIGYRDLEHVATGAKLANDALVWGAGQGSDQMAFARKQDAASITEHGRWQYGEFTTQLFRQSSVQARANSIVDGTPQGKRGGKDDQVSWMVTTFDPAFVVGQKVQIESEVFGFSDVVPIRRMTITFATKSRARYQMLLSHDIDEPWNTYEFFLPGFGFTIPPITFPPIDLPPIPPFPDFTCGITDTFNNRLNFAQADCGLFWRTVTGDPPTLDAGRGVLPQNTHVELPLDQPTMDAAISFEMETNGQFGIFPSDNTSIIVKEQTDEVLVTRTTLEVTETGSITITPGVNYRIRLLEGPDETQVKIWAVGDPEPGSWLVTNSESESGLVVNQFGVVAIAGEVLIDDVDIDGIDRCTAQILRDPVIIDDWERSISVLSYQNVETFPSEIFGTATCGVAWRSQIDAGDHRIMGVAGGKGVLSALDDENDFKNGLHIFEMDSGAQPPNIPDVLLSDYEGTIRFRTLNIPGQHPTEGGELELDFDLELDGLVIVFEAIFTGHSNSMWRLSGPTVVEQETPFAWTAGAWYTFKWRFEGNNIRAKFWADFESEPDWMLSDTDLRSAPYGFVRFEQFIDFVDTSSPANDPIPYMEIDDFIATPLTGGVPLPTEGPLCETPTRLDAITFQLSRKLTPGSAVVSIDGQFQRPGATFEYTEDIVEHQIVFNSTVPDELFPWVCYNAAGVI